jgi:hypothetical protein
MHLHVFIKVLSLIFSYIFIYTFIQVFVAEIKMKNCEKTCQKVKQNFISMDIKNVCKPTGIFTDTNIRYPDVNIYPEEYKEVDRLIQRLYDEKDHFKDKCYSSVFDIGSNWDQFEDCDDSGWISSELLPLICVGIVHIYT